MGETAPVEKAWEFADRAHKIERQRLAREYQQMLDEAQSRLASRGTALSGSMVMETVRIEAGRITSILKSRLDHLLEGLSLYKAEVDDLNTLPRLLQDIDSLRIDRIAEAKRNYAAGPLARLVSVENYSLSLESEVGFTRDEVMTQIERWRLKSGGDSGALDHSSVQQGDNKMPRRAVPQPKGPTLTPERSIPALEELITQATEVKAQPYGSAEKKQWGSEAKALLETALGEDHSILNSFSRDFASGVYGPGMSPQRLKAQSDRQVDGGVAALKAAVRHLHLQLPDSGQVFLPAGSQHDAYTEIRDLVSQAAREAVIVDTYVDGTLWTLLTNAGSGVRIRVLTQNMKPDFLLEAKKFSAQNGKAVEVRQTKTYHDRFIVLDGKRVIHLGASIKDLGNKASMISPISSPKIAAATITDIESEWSTAIPAL